MAGLRWCALLFLFAGGLVGAVARDDQPQTGNTWSIVAVDTETGDVGVAAASCVDVPIDALAALAPGKGAAAVQADFAIENRDRVYALLQRGENASTIIAAVTDPSLDRNAARRQYGVITLHGDGVEIAAFTGDATLPWSGARSDQPAAVTVQGNLLTGEAVVVNSLAAFRANETLPLPDRLIHALEAGSAAGGDRRCNQDDVQQTATAAFILVARGDEPSYAVRTFGSSDAGEANTPWLYLSVTEPLGGANPLLALRSQYNSWRQDRLPPCPGCTTPQVTLPGSATARPPTMSTTDWLLLGAAVLTTGTMLVVLWRGRQNTLT